MNPSRLGFAQAALGLTIRNCSAFVRLARPAFLFGGFAGFALGALVARYDGHPLALDAYLWGQALVTAFHLMVHFANDYYDQETDALTQRTRWSGGSGVLCNGELPAVVALRAALACATAGGVLVLRHAFAGAPLVALLGVAIFALAWAYSAPPLRLLARGLGELDTILVVAVLVPLTGYAAFAGTLGPHALIATLPGACAMFAMMLCVELPDRNADAATGKRNLAVRWGTARTRLAVRVGALIAVAAAFAVARATFGAGAALGALVVPAAIAVALQARTGPFGGVALYAFTVTAFALTVGTSAAP